MASYGAGMLKTIDQFTIVIGSVELMCLIGSSISALSCPEIL